ncbi:MAG: hypothetical protein OEY28_13050 [Nitrospira sp.]|nr:hypothetical protein [Nitrospira sp.]
MSAVRTTPLPADIVDVRGRRVRLGDRVIDLDNGGTCRVIDYNPDLGEESLYVRTIGGVGPVMSYWIEPGSLKVLGASG